MPLSAEDVAALASSNGVDGLQAPGAPIGVALEATEDGGRRRRGGSGGRAGGLVGRGGGDEFW